MDASFENILRITDTYIQEFEGRQNIVVDKQKFDCIASYYTKLLDRIKNEDTLNEKTITYNTRGYMIYDVYTNRRTTVHKNSIQLRNYKDFSILVIERAWNGRADNTEHYFKYGEYLCYYQHAQTNSWGTHIPDMFVLVQGKPATLINNIRQSLSEGKSVKMSANILEEILSFLREEPKKENNEPTKDVISNIQKYSSNTEELDLNAIDGVQGLVKGHRTYRAIKATYRNKRGNYIDVLYSRGVYIESKDVANHFKLNTNYIYSEQGVKLIDLTNHRAVSKKASANLYKQMDIIYSQIFTDETQLDKTWDEYLYDKNKLIARKNIQLKQKYLEEQNKCLEYMPRYTLGSHVTKFYDSSYEMFNGERFEFYIPNKQMNEQFGKILDDHVFYSMAYMCKDKETQLPISVILAPTRNSSGYAKGILEQRYKDYGSIRNFKTDLDLRDRYYFKFSTIIVKHSEVTKDNRVSGCEEYVTYDIEDTPKQYVNIIMRLLEIITYALQEKYANLFGFSGLDILSHTEHGISYIYSKHLDELTYEDKLIHVRNWNNKDTKCVKS